MRGFICERHQIFSQGAPLNLYRIINVLADQKSLNKYPVLYGHGVLYDASSMLSRSERSRPRKPALGKPTVKYPYPSDNSDDNSLPFMFSNNNFDVWMFDSRSVNENNRNISMEIGIGTPAVQKFWDFSLDDQGLYDLPALMDYVLFQTASTKLVYVGYSESTLFMFELMSRKPEVADKVAAFIALAPVAYVANIQGLTLPILMSISSLVPEFVQYSFVPQPVIETVDASMRNLCRSQGLSQLICGSVANGIGGNGQGQMGPEFFREFFKATSIKAVRHFVQMYLSKRFSMYDYGAKKNMLIYGQAEAPNYELRNVRSDRIILVRGLADFLSDPQDHQLLIKELRAKPYLDIVCPKYNHFDFIDGQDLIRQVNHPVMLAVYRLLYKDGPNILRTTDQNNLIAQRNATAQVVARNKDNVNVGKAILNPDQIIADASNIVSKVLPV